MTPGAKLKYAAGLGQYGLNFPASDYVDEGVRLIRTTDLAGGSLASEVTGIYVPQDAVDDTDRLSPGDLLLSRSGTIGRAYLAPKAADGMAFAGFLVRFRPGPDADGRFLFYCTQSAEFQAVVERDAISSTIQNFNADRYNNLEVPLPGLDEQRAIAHHLDRETDRIDTLIEEQQQLIEVLLERRQAVIDHALTLGAPMIRLGALASFHNGDRGASYPSRDEYVTDGVPFVNAGHLVGGHVDMRDMNFLTEEKYESMGGAKLREDDLLFCLRGSVGKFGRFPFRRGALASSLVAIRRETEDLLTPFVFWVMASAHFQEQISLGETGSAQPNLSVDQLRHFRVPLPSLGEQCAIVAHLDEQTAKIDELIVETERFIELSRERRSALITAAVTGQIDVREVA